MSWFSRAPKFSFTGGYVVVEDPAAAGEWYSRVFGCRTATYQDDELGESLMVRFFEEDPGLALLGPPKPDTAEPPPIMNTDDIEKAHTFLGDRGASLGPIQKDEQGTRFFELRDLSGNILEVAEEP